MTAVSSLFIEVLRDRYVVDRELGRGGMATVFLAHDLKHDRPSGRGRGLSAGVAPRRPDS